jgi:hypothetical protein
MGSRIELNDTLQITTEQGFPAEVLDRARHQQQPIALADVAGRTFAFRNKSGARIFHTPPTRCFLVHNIGEKWLYWGWVHVLSQTITTDDQGDAMTSGTFRIVTIYDPVYQEQMTRQETHPGKSYFA